MRKSSFNEIVVAPDAADFGVDTKLHAYLLSWSGENEMITQITSVTRTTEYHQRFRVPHVIRKKTSHLFSRIFGLTVLRRPQACDRFKEN